MSSIPRQIATIVSGRGLIRLSQFVTFVLLARFLSPEAFGWFGILTTAFVLAATIGSLGLRQSFAYQIGQNKMTSGEANGTMLALWPILTLMSAAAVIALYGEAVPSISFMHASWIIFAGVAGTMFLTLVQGTFLGRGDIRSFTLSESLPRLALLLSTAALTLLGAVTLSTALWAQVGGFVAMIPLALWLACRGAGRLRLRFDSFLPMLGYGLIFAINLFLITLGGRLAMFVIEHHHTAAEAGQFFAAVRVNEIFLEIATAVGMVLFSDVARKESSQATIVRNARIGCWMLWLFMVLAVIIVISAPLFVALTLGSGFEQAAPALQILALGLGPAAANKVLYPTFAGAGKPYFGTPVIIIGIAINAALALVLVPGYGVRGGAIAVVAGQYAVFAGYILLCRTRYQVSVRTMVLPRAADARSLAANAKLRVWRKVRAAPANEHNDQVRRAE